MSRFTKSEILTLILVITFCVILFIYPIFFLSCLIRFIAIISAGICILTITDKNAIKYIFKKKIVKKAMKRRG